ncbi:Omp28-related outer membrane protein [Flavobacterium sp.]|uniref:Omp28-related outer membrane protein n=1 Tax=Flavobacterium sp. TaxID=239 RepID=UPI00333F763B
MKKILFATITFLGLINVSCISNDWEDNSVSSAVIEQPISGKFLKNVLIEDYTGTWCQYCPRVLHGIKQVESEQLRAFPVSIHRSVASSPDPYDFPATPLEQLIGVTGYPTAMLNRNVLWDNEISTTEVKNQIKPNANLGLALNSIISGGTINLNVNIKFLENFSNLKLVVYVLEDGLIYNQVNATSFFGAQNPIINFEHDHVLRACLTDLVNGDALTGTTAGASVIKNFTFTIPSNIANVTNMNFVAFVLDATGKAINVRGAAPNLIQTYQINP